jgi:hypothetical protein
MEQMMASHCKCLAAYSQQNYLEAYDSLVTSTMVYLKMFKAADSPWVIEPLYVLIRDLRVMAELADAELRKQGKNASKMSDAGSQLMRCFRESLAGAGHKAKKIVTLFVVNQLFKIYFKLNTLHLCKNLIKAVDSPQVGSHYQPHPTVGLVLCLMRESCSLRDDLLLTTPRAPSLSARYKEGSSMQVISSHPARCGWEPKVILCLFPKNLHDLKCSHDGFRKTL